MRIKNIKLKLQVISLVFLLLEPITSFGSEETSKLFESQQYDEVINHIEAELKGKAPLDSADLLFDLGKAYYKKGLIYNSFYETGRELEKDDYERLKNYGIDNCLSFYLGVCYFEMEQYQKAIDEFKSLKNAKGVDKNYQTLASIWLEASRFQSGQREALSKLEEIRENSDNNPLAVSEVSFFLSYLANNDKEALSFIQGRKSPKNSFTNRFYRNLSFIFMKNSLYDQAKEAYGMMQPEKEEFTVEINPKLQISFYDLTSIKVLAFLNYYFSEQALTGVTADQVTNPQWQTALWYRGQDALYLGEYQKAAELLAQSEHPVALVHLGTTYYRSGRTTDAMAAWSEVEKADDDRALRELGRQYIALKLDPAKGVKLCKQALDHIIKTDPDEGSEYFRCLGWAYLEAGDADNAVKTLDEGYDYSRVNDLNFYEPEILNERAFCLYRKSKLNWGEAIEIYFTLLKRYPVVRQLHNALQGIAVSESSGIGSSKL